MGYLRRLVVWCLLDAACQDGKSLSDCLGEVVKEVTCNGKTVLVKTNITKNDISIYRQTKAEKTETPETKCKPEANFIFA